MHCIVVGLGNPGDAYERTRHNVGRIAVASLGAKQGEADWRSDSGANATVLETAVATLVLPDTYMNNSGRAVSRYIRSKEEAVNLIVVYDDIDLPLGKIKVSFARGSGGHNGIASIINALGTKQFVRVRIGVAPTDTAGNPRKPRGTERVQRFLLSPFTRSEEAKLPQVFETVHAALATIFTAGHGEAMNRFNQG